MVLTQEMDSGITPFLLACSSGVLELVKYFVEVLGSSILAACNEQNGRTALHYACRFGCITVVKSFFNKDRNSNLRDKDGMTPLHHACSCKISVAWKAALVGQNKHMEVIRFLVEECDCSLDTMSNTGCTPLHIASGQENLAVIKHLVEHYNCNPSLTNNNGDTALHIACRAGVSLKIVQYLVKGGQCDPCAKGKGGMTALHIACSHGSLEIVQFLVESYPCSFRTQSDDGTTPLGIANSSGHIDIQKYLITYRKGKKTVEHSPQQLDSHLEKDANEAIRLLADKPVLTVEYYNKWRDTLLHLACLYGDENTVQYLIEEKKHKATVTNSEGDSVLNMACWGGTHAHIHTRTHACTHTAHTHNAYTHSHTHAHIHARMHTHIHACMHIPHAHTHTPHTHAPHNTHTSHSTVFLQAIPIQKHHEVNPNTQLHPHIKMNLQLHHPGMELSLATQLP